MKVGSSGSSVSVRAAVSALLAICLCAPIEAFGYALQYGGPWYCNGNPLYISNHRALSIRCPNANTTSLSNGSGPGAYAAGWAWQNWWFLNTANNAVWIQTAGSCVNTTVPAADGANVAWLSTAAFSLGRASLSVDCPVAGTPDIRSVDIEVNSTLIPLPTSCAIASFAQMGTWVHEIGHAYGQAHFDGWLSTMNTSQPDVTSCRSDLLVRPSSDAQQGHGARYTLPTAYDVGGTGLVAVCPLTGSGCAAMPANPNVPTIVPASRVAPVNATISFTSMNMRSAWPNASIPIDLYLSANSVVDSGDTFLAGAGLLNTQAGAIYTYQIGVSFNPAVMTIGQTYCVLVRWDSTNTVSEFDEADNTLNSSYCFMRL